jgi:hypothetical protein
MVQVRSRHYKPLARLGTGVFVLVVVQGLCAPVSAWAGCSHQVTSQSDSARLPSLVGSLMDDFAGEPRPHQAPSRACTGAWCSGQPATPAVPAAVLDWGLQSWAWWSPDAGSISSARSFISSASLVLRPAHCRSPVFHPPRLVPIA